ncbi:hypothetical protein Tco_0667171 [Tanacetum coccineum]
MGLDEMVGTDLAPPLAYRTINKMIRFKKNSKTQKGYQVWWVNDKENSSAGSKNSIVSELRDGRYGFRPERKSQMAIGRMRLDRLCGIVDVNKSPGPTGPRSLKGCRPKILAALAMVIAGLVSNTQSAFVAGRQILDGPFILNEVLDWCKRKKKKALFFKVDFAKAMNSSLGHLALTSLRLLISVRLGELGLRAFPWEKIEFSLDRKVSIWSSILKEVQVLKSSGFDFLSYCSKRIGGGQSTSFWKETWIGDIPLLVLSTSNDRWYFSLSSSGEFSVKDTRLAIDDLVLPSHSEPTRSVVRGLERNVSHDENRLACGIVESISHRPDSRFAVGGKIDFQLLGVRSQKWDRGFSSIRLPGSVKATPREVDKKNDNYTITKCTNNNKRILNKQDNPGVRLDIASRLFPGPTILLDSPESSELPWPMGD